MEISIHPLERTEKISVPSNPQDRKITPTKSNNNTSPSKPSTSMKRPREQERQEKEAASEKKKAHKLEDKEEGEKSGGGKKRKLETIREEEQEEEKEASKPSYKENAKAGKMEDREKSAKEEKKNAGLKKKKEKSAPIENITGSEEKRKEMAGREEKRKEMEISTSYQPSTTKISIDVNNTYHVFLSFRGADVRETLVAHLYESLCEAGLTVFLDSEELEKGRDIESSLQTAIEKSEILIPIFSKRYAESTWCLKEAERMCRSKGFIIPLFYDVEPCDVRFPQRKGGKFAKGFQKHYNHLDRQDESTIQSWEDALRRISHLSGWTLEAESRYERRLVKRVVKDVLNTLKNVPLDVPVHLVGLERDMNYLRDRLNLGSMDSTVRVGIMGIGGVGKTTLAKAVYNEICGRFDACCFLFNIGASGQDDTRLRDLQGRILRGLVNYQREVSSVDEGRVLMRDRLRGRRILLILDDVNHTRQLHAVNGDWFGPGSRIIITSRDEHILNLAKVDSVLQMCGLKEEEALQLFSWHAFFRAFPENPYEELSTRIVKACCGNPLALEVIGAHLSDKKDPDDIQCWEEAQFNIGENPDISRVLRISYDGLSPVEKEMFLDIACYFVGERIKEVVIFWEVLYPNKVQTAIKNLSLKMLINTSGFQPEFLDMHDLVRQMGRGIQEQADNNSRLWLPMGAYKALNRDREEGVKMLSYTGENGREPVSLHSMPNLRYLFVQNTKLVGNIGELPPNLIWIKIRNCEFVSDRSWISWLMSRNRQQFEGSLSQLRILSVEQCASLTRFPKTLDKLVNLQCLSLENCSALTTLPNTLGNLSQLKQFNLCGCASLTSLPDTLGNMERLRYLRIEDCSALTTLPNTLGDLSQLWFLVLHLCYQKCDAEAAFPFRTAETPLPSGNAVSALLCCEPSIVFDLQSSFM